MKKLLSLVLALALVFTFAVSAFAANLAYVDEDAAVKMEQITGKTEEDVHINVNANTEAVYRVSLVWESMDFNYTLGKWDTDNYRYVEGTWDDPDSTIVITNHSNRDVDYTVTCTPNNSWGDVTFAVANGVNTIDYVVEGVAGQAAATVSSETATITISGDPKTTVKDQVVGTITVAFVGTDDQAGVAYDATALDVPADWDDLHLIGNEDRTAVKDVLPS
jgi:hypothetical protein